jgi:hypothetical protein
MEYFQEILRWTGANEAGKFLVLVLLSSSTDCSIAILFRTDLALVRQDMKIGQ